MSLILASASTTRAGLLRAAGVPFEIRPAHVDEDAIKDSMLADGADARAVADALAEAKALRISLSCPGELVLGADQVLDFESELVSKSPDLEAAAILLRRLRGKAHKIVTAAVLARDGVPIWRHLTVATMTMRDFSDAFLAGYLADEGDGVLSSVGCFQIERRGLQLFSRIDGDYYSILGLPMIPLLTALRAQGIIAT
ncbi:MAG: Maf family protein [Alphaproteobacteria bacterium]|nr:Maf family protein [Alphaproteobacteria bacterium]MDE2012268.1 Maf family protein [Alphaproteobacteria bacterium]MDE2072835.1 Maf family protein [Alphaproteobacteria bacterium]